MERLRAWTKHRQGPHTPLGETQRRKATCPWPHSMLTAYTGPEPSSYLWLVLFPCQMACVLALALLNQPVLGKVSIVIPACVVGDESPRSPHSVPPLVLLTSWRICGDGDGERGRLRLLLGAGLILEQLPALHGYEADPEWRLLF